MSGTYQISQPGSSTMEQFISNPLSKSPRLQQIATGGQGEPIFASFFTWDFNWEHLPKSEALFFESRYIAGGLYNAILPHPRSGALVSFTGVAIENVDYSVNDVERDSWVDSLSVTLRVNFYATGTF